MAWTPLGALVTGTDLDGRKIAGAFGGYFCWIEPVGNSRAYVILEDGFRAVVHDDTVETVRRVEGGAASSPVRTDPLIGRDINHDRFVLEIGQRYTRRWGRNRPDVVDCDVLRPHTGALRHPIARLISNPLETGVVEPIVSGRAVHRDGVSEHVEGFDGLRRGGCGGRSGDGRLGMLARRLGAWVGSVGASRHAGKADQYQTKERTSHCNPSIAAGRVRTGVVPVWGFGGSREVGAASDRKLTADLGCFEPGIIERLIARHLQFDTCVDSVVIAS